MKQKNIGILTSGGDAPGMNAAVRAVVRTACENGMKVFGINRGYAGLIEDDVRELNIRSVSDIIHRGGTMLHSARCKEFKEESGMKKAIATCRKHEIEGIVVIGGVTVSAVIGIIRLLLIGRDWIVAAGRCFFVSAGRKGEDQHHHEEQGKYFLHLVILQSLLEQIHKTCFLFGFGFYVIKAATGF